MNLRTLPADQAEQSTAKNPCQKIMKNLTLLTVAALLSPLSIQAAEGPASQQRAQSSPADVMERFRPVTDADILNPDPADWLM